MQQTFVVPYQRMSPIDIPRRDLVLAAPDSVLLSVSIIESDDPAAEALVITGGVGAPSLRMTVWSDSRYDGRYYGGWFGGSLVHDYGWGMPRPGAVLWSGVGTVDPDTLGTFDITIPIGTMTNWPRRCVYALQLDWGGGTSSETLAEGALHVRLMAAAGPPASEAPALLTDDGIPVLTDDSTQVLA